MINYERCRTLLEQEGYVLADNFSCFIDGTTIDFVRDRDEEECCVLDFDDSIVSEEDCLDRVPKCVTITSGYIGDTGLTLSSPIEEKEFRRGLSYSRFNLVNDIYLKNKSIQSLEWIASVVDPILTDADYVARSPGTFFCDSYRADLVAYEHINREWILFSFDQITEKLVMSFSDESQKQELIPWVTTDDEVRKLLMIYWDNDAKQFGKYSYLMPWADPVETKDSWFEYLKLMDFLIDNDGRPMPEDINLDILPEHVTRLI